MSDSGITEYAQTVYAHNDKLEGERSTQRVLEGIQEVDVTERGCEWRLPNRELLRVWWLLSLDFL